MKKDKFMKYSVAMATGLAATNAFSDIIYTDIVDLTLTMQVADDLFIDFDGQKASIEAIDGRYAFGSGHPTAEICFYAANTTMNYFSIYQVSANYTIAGVPDGSYGYYTVEFSAGDQIGTGSSFETYGNMVSLGEEMGQYVGVYLTGGDDGAYGNDGCYGWIQLSYNKDDGTLTVYDFAYEDSGASIEAGAGVEAIPEPTALALLAVAGTAALATRRFRAA